MDGGCLISVPFNLMSAPLTHRQKKQSPIPSSPPTAIIVQLTTACKQNPSEGQIPCLGPREGGSDQTLQAIGPTPISEDVVFLLSPLS